MGAFCKIMYNGTNCLLNIGLSWSKPKNHGKSAIWHKGWNHLYVHMSKYNCVVSLFRKYCFQQK